MRSLFKMIAVVSIILFNNGCVPKNKPYKFGEVETNEITQIGQYLYKVVKSVRINIGMDEIEITEKLEQSLSDEATSLCVGTENIESSSHQFFDTIHMSHGMTEREQKKTYGLLQKYCRLYSMS